MMRTRRRKSADTAVIPDTGGGCKRGERGEGRGGI